MKLLFPQIYAEASSKFLKETLQVYWTLSMCQACYLIWSLEQSYTTETISLIIL